MKKEQEGCVYFFRHLTTSPVKIGYSERSTPLERFSQFKTFAPFGAELLGFIKAKNPKELESLLHKKYLHKRLNGEWFDIDKKDVEKVIKNYSMESELVEKSDFQIEYAKRKEIQMKEVKKIMLDNELILDTLKRLLKTKKKFNKSILATEAGVSRRQTYYLINSIKSK